MKDGGRKVGSFVGLNKTDTFNNAWFHLHINYLEVMNTS